LKSIQDLCVEAILQESKQLAIDCIATDVNCGSFKMAEAIFEEMMDVQRKFLPNFK
jgi:alpha-galactosidase/6-phospho-beta-glucosidase family protein